MTKYIIAFVAFLLSIFGIYSVQTDIAANVNQRNAQYTSYLTSSVQDAAREMKKGGDNSVLMPNESDRIRVRDTFFKSLSMNYGYTTQEDMERLHMYVPVFAMIDFDGYYLAINERSTAAEGTVITPVIEGPNTWTAVTDDGEYMVKYRLDNNVEVTNVNTGVVETGNFMDIFEKLGSPDSLRPLGFSSRTDEVSEDDILNPWSVSGYDSGDKTWDNIAYFTEKKNERIIPEIEKTIEFYINRNNDFGTEYRFSMPTTEYNDWVNLLKNPSCLAFLQGMKVSDGDNYLNIYAFGGGEVGKQPVTKILNASDTGELQNQYYAYKDTNEEAAGYLPNGKAAALAGGEEKILTSEEKAAQELTAVHHHWGSATTGTGCYTTPVYHKHTSGCYDIIHHTHIVTGGIPVTADMALEKDIYGNAYSVLPQYGGPGTCFNTEVKHRHTDACYQDVYHVHTGSSTTGGGCYSVPNYHVHTAECYSAGKDIVYQPTKKTYHTHKLPILYYAKIDDDSGAEYSGSLVKSLGIEDEVYVVRADASIEGCCYKDIKYTRPVYRLHGNKTLYADTTYDPVEGEMKTWTYIAPEAGTYVITSKNHRKTVYLPRLGKLIVRIGETSRVYDEYNEVVMSTGEHTPESITIDLEEHIVQWTNDELVRGKKYEDMEKISEVELIAGTNGYYLYEGEITYERDEMEVDHAGTGINLVKEGYIFSDMDEMTCGLKTTDIEKEEPIGEPIISREAGELICGKTESTIESYSLGCGYIDIHDSNSAEMAAYHDGKLSSSYVLSRALERQDVICGHAEGELVGYRMSCGKDTGSYDGSNIICGKVAPGDKDASGNPKTPTIESYELGCGLQDGQKITQAQADKFNEP